MVCKCGHTKFRHEYQTDTQDKTGQCMLIEISNSGKKKVCSCRMYLPESTSPNSNSGGGKKE